MPDISYQQQLLRQMQDPNSEMSPIGAMRALSNSIGNAWQGWDAGQDEKAAVNFFTQNDTTPENLQRFQAEYPRMPLVDIYKYAGAIGKQKKAQAMIDNWKTLQTAIKNAQDKGEDFDFSSISKIIPDLSPEFIERVKQYKELYPEAKIIERDPTKDIIKTVGGKMVGDIIKGTPKEEKPSEWIMSPDGKTKRLETPAEARRLVNEEGYTKYELPRNEKKVKLYKGTGRNVAEQEIEGDAAIEKAKREGWTTQRPLWAPPEPEKEYTPKQALSRISTIDATIARMKSSGTVDTSMAIQNPMLAALVDTKDPEAVKQAIASLETERGYVRQFAPKGVVKTPELPKQKKLDMETAKTILKEANGDKVKARELAKQRGYSF